MGSEDLTVIADRGYFKGEEILACDEAGITTFLPKPQTSGSQAEGRFGKRDFHYIPKDDEYRCPAGERLKWRMTTVEKGQRVHRYWSLPEVLNQGTLYAQPVSTRHALGARRGH